MTKLITIAIIVALLYGGWQFFLYWERVRDERETQERAAAAAVVTGESLEGVPQPLEASLRAAQGQGVAGLRNWLKTYGSQIQDPRKAWLELDYCIMIVRDNPAEARRIYTAVKERTSPASPVWPRIKQMQSMYE